MITIIFKKKTTHFQIDKAGCIVFIILEKLLWEDGQLRVGDSTTWLLRWARPCCWSSRFCSPYHRGPRPCWWGSAGGCCPYWGTFRCCRWSSCWCSYIGGIPRTEKGSFTILSRSTVNVPVLYRGAKEPVWKAQLDGAPCVTLLCLETSVMRRPSPLLAGVLPGEREQAKDLFPSVGVPAHRPLSGQVFARTTCILVEIHFWNTEQWEIHRRPASSFPDTAPSLPTLLPSFPLLFSWHCPFSQVQPGQLFREHSSSHCEKDLVGKLVSLSPLIRMFCCTQERLARSKNKSNTIHWALRLQSIFIPNAGCVSVVWAMKWNERATPLTVAQTGLSEGTTGV